MKDAKIIAEELESVRQERGLSYMDLEKRTGLSHSTIQRYLSRKSKKLSVDHMAIIASAMGLDPKQVIGWTGDDTPRPPLMPEEAQLLSMTRKMTQEEKQRVLNVMRLMFPEYRDDK